MKRVIGFTGLPGSGKTTALEGVKDLGRIVIMGDVVRNEAIKRKIPLNGKNLGKISKELRANYGKDVIAVRCIDLIKSISNNNTIFIDGLRSKSEVEAFRNVWKFPTIAVIIDEERRRQLLFERSRSDDPISLNQIKKREQREEKFGIIEVIKSVDYQIVNDGNKESLMKKTRSLVKKIIEDY